jgi:hypothetical protein
LLNENHRLSGLAILNVELVQGPNLTMPGAKVNLNYHEKFKNALYQYLLVTMVTLSDWTTVVNNIKFSKINI